MPCVAFHRFSVPEFSSPAFSSLAFSAPPYVGLYDIRIFPVLESGENGLGDEWADVGNDPQNFWLEPPLLKPGFRSLAILLNF